MIRSRAVRLFAVPLALAACVVVTATPARAVVDPGQPAPAFTKNVLGGVPAQLSLSDLAGKVVVLHILGYS